MKYVTDAALMRDCDEKATDERMLPPIVLMERAAVATADIICARYSTADISAGTVVLCGTGNNGGDGAAVARILCERGYKTRIVIVGDEINATLETQHQLNIAYRTGVRIDSASQLGAKLEEIIGEASLIIDALFGIGLSRPVVGVYADIIGFVNRRRASDIVSLDIPSGINAGSGQIMGTVVKAGLTITYSYFKIGQLLYPGAEYCGKLVLADAGIHTLSYSDTFFLEPNDLDRLPHRRSDSNKGDFGRVLCICGSVGMSGAAYLSAAAAYRCGAGIVECVTPGENREILQTLLPEAIFTDRGSEQSKLLTSIKRAAAICIGPGIGIDDSNCELVKFVLSEAEKTVILDADALNCVAAYKIELKSCASLIVTPHIMEMKRLCGLEIDKIKADPIYCAGEYARRNNLICLLKDARSIITDGASFCINISGNNGMSTGGSGDVLSGIVAGLAAQGSDSLTAAQLGAYVHGLAGDAAAKKRGQHAMLAHDIIEALGDVLDYKYCQ